MARGPPRPRSRSKKRPDRRHCGPTAVHRTVGHHSCLFSQALMNVIGPTYADPRTSDNWTMSRRLADGFTNKEPVIRFIDYDMVLIDD